MSNEAKERLSRWLPLAVAIVTNLVIVAYGYGKLEQRLSPVEAHVVSTSAEKLHAQFVSRNEYEQRRAHLDNDIKELRADLRAMDAKLDRLLERK